MTSQLFSPSRLAPMRRPALWSAIPLIALSPSASPAKNVLPPPPLDAGAAGVGVRITHTHRAVRACRLQSPASEERCTAKLEPADAATKLALTPIPSASLEHRNDPRNVISVSLGSGRPTSTVRVEVGVGLWEIAWPGYRREPRFSAKPDDSISVELETITGRCDATPGECKLVSDSSKRRVRIALE